MNNESQLTTENFIPEKNYYQFFSLNFLLIFIQNIILCDTLIPNYQIKRTHILISEN